MHQNCPTVRLKKKEGGCKVDYGLTCPFFFVYAWVLCFWSVFLPFVLLVPCFFFFFFFVFLLLLLFLVLVFLQTWKERSTWSKKGRKEKERKERNPMRRRKRKKGRKEKKMDYGLTCPFFWCLCECVTVVFFFCFVFLPFVLLGPCFFFFLFVFLLVFLFLSLSKNGRKDLAGLRKEESKNKGRKGILWEEGRERKEERKKQMEGKIYLV